MDSKAAKSSIDGDPWFDPVNQGLKIIKCNVEGKPTPQVTWYKLDEISSTGAPAPYVSNNGVLVFPDLDPNTASGLYICNVSNSLGQDLSYFAGKQS
ncbi:hypothetical protein ElyMa_006806500 [Elysia marginata]|uniref:Ig-like domain-containing protein n=1 Tax=Elysia marginata TaxID=1093978 RepID=A0AAV4J798_9GAST|nr:hypothetical protein ElyMa_006806500 [Elysia marginata]